VNFRFRRGVHRLLEVGRRRLAAVTLRAPGEGSSPWPPTATGLRYGTARFPSQRSLTAGPCSPIRSGLPEPFPGLWKL